MASAPTCGQGLAQHSSLPTKLGELTACVAEVLEAHTSALDLHDEQARRERDVYVRLASAHHRAAVDLEAIGREMAGYQDLPMGRHDPAAMSSPQAVDAFQRFVSTERDLLALLEVRVQQDQELLAEMADAGRGPTHD